MIDFCPELEVLVSIGRGGDGGTCEPALAAHIENCPLCREFIERYAQRGVDSLHPILITSLPMDDMMPRIDGFTIERELGRGSTGVVYLARRDALSRLVALKLWPGGRRASESERSKWQREAEAVASVSHPNVVTLYEACVTDDWFLLVLEFVPGGTLKDRLTQPLGARDAARLVECVARAIHRIHELGILHLDLKPSNILLDGKADAPLDRMVPKVSDFSVARTRAATTTDTAGMVGGGTPSYMAPEQLMSERSKLTAAADIHGLGAILYHMLTGRPPYQGATLVETIDQLRHLDVVPPRRLNPGIPRDLETICLKCLERDPGRRYATAEALADELGRWLDGRAILTRRVSVVEKSLRLCRRRPVISVLSGALVLTVVISFLAVVDQWRRAEANFQAALDLAGGFLNSTNEFAADRTIDGRIQTLDGLRSQLLALSARRPGDLRVARQLASAESELANALARAGKFEEARRILVTESERIGELVRQHPLEKTLRHQMQNCLCQLGSMSERLDGVDVSIALYKRALDTYTGQSQKVRDPEEFRRCVELRRDLAWLLMSRGQVDEATRLILANETALEQPPSGIAPTWLVVGRVMCRIDVLEMTSDGASSAPHETGRQATSLSRALSGLTPLLSVGQTPAEWASHVAAALRCDDSGSPVSTEAEMAAALFLFHRLIPIASRLRGVGDVDRAGRLTDRMLAFSNILMQAYPHEATAYLVRSHAYAQIYKNACASNHGAAVEPNMRLAYESAQHALFLDPARVDARQAVEDLHRRLAALPRRG